MNQVLTAREIPVGETGVFPCLECGEEMVWLRKSPQSGRTPKWCRSCWNKLRAERQRNSDAYANYLEKQKEERRENSRVGKELVFTRCSRCDRDFAYLFKARRRTVCDECRSHDSEWSKFRLSGPEAKALRSQGTCAVCGGSEPGGRFGNWHIDHDHGTGEVRGILCSACNTTLGLMGDSPERLRAAADYLERND